MIRIVEIALIIVACVGLVFTGCSMDTQARRELIIKAEKENSQAIEETEELEDSDRGESSNYTYKANLKNILILGIDDAAMYEVNKLPPYHEQADSIMVLTMNEESKEAKLLQINRDTTVDINYYDKGGMVAYDAPGPLALQYACASGTQASIWAMKQSVKKLLNDTPIDGYLVLDYTSMDQLVDSLGGMQIHLDKDYSNIFPNWTKGSDITMTGQMAQEFLRYKNKKEKDPETSRMKRQLAFLNGFFKLLSDHKDQAAEILESVETDLDESTFRSIANCKIAEEDIEYFNHSSSQ